MSQCDLVGEVRLSLPIRRLSIRAAPLWASVALSFWMLLVSGLGRLSANAYADATAGPAPTYSHASGPPDGRAYEEVSPPNKSGAQAGAAIDLKGVTGVAQPALASPDGDSVFYRGFPQGAGALSGSEYTHIASRNGAGWHMRPALPRPVEIKSFIEAPEAFVDPAKDLSHVWFIAPAPFVSPGDPPYGSNIYLAGEDPLQQPVWLGRPTISSPSPAMGSVNTNGIEPAGGAPDLSRVYFSYYGTLIAADAPRSPYVESLIDTGFYEWTEAGGLVSAGVLPDGSVSPFGAIPAGELNAPSGRVKADLFNNQVSEDGSRAFFLSPNPAFVSSPSLAGICNIGNSGSGGCVPELYVRERGPPGTPSTALVSRDTLLPANNGLPAGAPHGVVTITTPSGATENSEGDEKTEGANSHQTSLYASPDGSQAFFESVDALTSDAPSDGMSKEYDFETATNSLRYLPNVTDDAGGTAAVVTSSPDGSRILFVRMSGTNDAGVGELELWTEGPNGGSVTLVSPLPAVPAGPATTHVSSGHSSENGMILLFTSNSPLPGGFNNLAPGREANVEEVYRYEVATNTLSCISCPPADVTPNSSARVSSTESMPKLAELVRDRGMSADGSRVFFDTADPLVPRDINGMRDVYEWANGVVSLVSAGTGPGDSLILDNSEDGGDVFFATTDGLSSADTDGEYDVYDARIPRPGDRVAGSAEPCQLGACRPGSEVPALVSAGGSATFSGPGNLAAAPTLAVTKPAQKKVMKTKKKRKAKRHTVRRSVARSSRSSAAKGGRR